MNTFGINTFRSVRDGIHERINDVTWDDFVASISENGHRPSASKDGVKLFNATRFKSLDEVLREDCGGYREEPDGTPFVRRQQRNALEVELLILDYDGTLTLDEAKERFKAYEYLGYTSYGHLKKPGVHKFRLVFPLTQPIPAFKKFDDLGMLVEQGVYYDMSEALMEFAPACDPVVTKAIQPFYLPSAPAERIADASIWTNTGKVLDWTTWKKNDAYTAAVETSSIPRQLNGRPNRLLDADQEFRHHRGVVKAANVRGRIQKVACPYHADVKGSEFLVQYDSGVVCFHCKQCGTFTLQPKDKFSPAAAKEIHSTKTIETTENITPTTGVEMEGEVWWDHTDRMRVGDFLAAAKKTIMADKGLNGPRRDQMQFKSHVLYLPEGAGKSQLAMSFLKDEPVDYFHNGMHHRHQIIFACKSWKQVMEKQASFEPQLKKIGRTSRIAWSFDGSIYRRFNVRIKRRGNKPFAPGTPLNDETIEEIIRLNPHLTERHIRMTWTILGDDQERFERMAVPDRIYAQPETPTNDEDLVFDDLGDESGAPPPAIIFTTFAQLRLLAVKHDRVPLNWIVWIDDPDIDELLDIKPQRSGSPSEDDEDDEFVVIDGTRYDVRPENTSLGIPFVNHRCIYTTTERVTLRLLKHQLDKHEDPYVVHGERHSVTGGRITMLGTNKVQKKFDALVPLLIRRLQKDHDRPVTLIADGIPAEFNHSTNKGRNDLKDRDLLVEVSQPHPAQIKTVCDALGLNFTQNRHQIARDLMVDKMHQAIGRNSGYRTEGRECVVLLDKNSHAALVADCGYAIDPHNSVVIDKTEKMGRRDSRLTESASPLVKQIDSFLNNPTDYLSDMRKVKPDVNFVIDQFTDDLKRRDYLVRLLVALTSVTQVRFDLDPSSSPSTPEPYLTGQVRELGLWVLTLIPEGDREKIFTRYRQELKIDEVSEVG